MGEIAGSSDIVFVSTDEFIEIPRPVMPNMVNIGGLGESQSGRLDQTFERIAEMSGKGMIYFSLGTVVNTTLISMSVMENLVRLAEVSLFVSLHDLSAKRDHDSRFPDLLRIPSPCSSRFLRPAFSKDNHRCPEHECS